jgi:hypothetical protein
MITSIAGGCVPEFANSAALANSIPTYSTLEISIVWERALWVLSSPLQSVVGADRGSLTNKSSMLMSSVAIDGFRVADLFLITPVLTI